MSTETPKPNPQMFGRAKNGFAKIGEEADKAGAALAKLSEAIPQNKKQGPRVPFERKEHLTQRPFLRPEIIGLRKGLDRNVRIKKK